MNTNDQNQNSNQNNSNTEIPSKKVSSITHVDKKSNARIIEVDRGIAKTIEVTREIPESDDTKE
jgi:hypothetical protein